MDISLEEQEYMGHALRLACQSASRGTGPFGAVIVQRGSVIAEGWNQVATKNDPTAHAEIEAIRTASETLGTFTLTGCTLYTSTYPCPMCFGALRWAGIERVYYATSSGDAERAGFRDKQMYGELCASEEEHNPHFKQIIMENAEEPFLIWKENGEAIRY